MATPFTPHGEHLLVGEWVRSSETVTSDPVHGIGHAVSRGTPALVDRACRAAEEAFWTYAHTSEAERAAFLNGIADEIEARAAAITDIGCRETGLPEARLDGERLRTTGQLRLFADHILTGRHLDFRHDPALPDRQPAPRPEIRMVQRPVGPVAVFGASNFPLAFSTAGGDTAAALAAGCPVVVKGHEAHPGTAEVVADAILAAIRATRMPAGVFALVHDGGHTVGRTLVQHPLIAAVGFTGSLRGGRALFDLCAQRETPIPFFGELGSVNPMFILPDAARDHCAEIGKSWAASLTLGAGQFCTNPGLAIVPVGPEGDKLISTAVEALAATPAQHMLTQGIANAYASAVARVATHQDVRPLFTSQSGLREARPNLFETQADAFLADPLLRDEVFGPLGMVVRTNGVEEMLSIAHGLDGQLTATLHIEEKDTPLAKQLIPVLERKAGRILVNGFPTGVEVCDAMVHGGPYPASTNFGATSVGTLSIRRFLRPVAYQNFPDGLLIPAPHSG